MVPGTVLVADNDDDAPVHMDAGVAVGVMTGLGFTVTATVVELVHPPAPVTVSEYVPVAEGVALMIIGFCSVLLKPPGPVQLYPKLLFEVNLSVSSLQIGLLLPAMGAEFVFTIIATIAVVVHPLELSIPVTLYTVELVGVATGLGQVVQDNPLVGDQEYELAVDAFN